MKSIRQWTCRIPNIWCVKQDGKNIGTLTMDAKKVVENDVLAWFHQFDDLGRLLDALINSNSKDFAERYRVAFGASLELPGFIALRLGRKDLALDLLKKAEKADVFKERYDRVAFVHDKIREAIRQLE